MVVWAGLERRGACMVAHQAVGMEGRGRERGQWDKGEGGVGGCLHGWFVIAGQMQSVIGITACARATGDLSSAVPIGSRSQTSDHASAAACMPSFGWVGWRMDSM